MKSIRKTAHILFILIFFFLLSILIEQHRPKIPRAALTESLMQLASQWNNPAPPAPVPPQVT
jgi:hypothetical protein